MQQAFDKAMITKLTGKGKSQSHSKEGRGARDWVFNRNYALETIRILLLIYSIHYMMGLMPLSTVLHYWTITGFFLLTFFLLTAGRLAGYFHLHVSLFLSPKRWYKETVSLLNPHHQYFCFTLKTCLGQHFKEKNSYPEENLRYGHNKDRIL